MILQHYDERSWEEELGWAESRLPGHYSLELELPEWGILILSLQRQWNQGWKTKARLEARISNS